MFEDCEQMKQEAEMQRMHDEWVKEYTKKHGRPPIKFSDWYQEKYPERIKNGLPRGCPRDYNWAALRGNCTGKKRKFSEFAGLCEDCWNAYIDDFFFPDLAKRDESKKKAIAAISKVKKGLKEFNGEVKKELPKVIEAVALTDWEEVRDTVVEKIVEDIEDSIL